MSKQKKSVRRAPMPAAKLTTGWVGPNKTRIRLARAEETADINTLMERAGVRLIPALRAAIEDGTAATGIRTALERATTRAWRDSATRAFTTNRNALPSMSLPLAAVDDRGQVIGAAVVTPPASFMEQLVDLRSTQGLAYAVVLTATVAKLHGLAVADHAEGQGVGAALSDSMWKVYSALGIKILYGAFETDRNLSAFYAKCGYTVHPEGEGVSLGPIFPASVNITPFSGELLFSRREAGFPV